MLKRVKKIFELESSTGIILLIASLASLLISNSRNFAVYQNFFAIPMPLDLGFFGIYKELTLRDWINDFLMAFFFLLVGLELKEEILYGELSSKERAILPAIAACGGVIVPALIFYLCNFSQEQNLVGFAIPTATDIAFAYGVICIFGKKIPKSLKVFLISLAIFDDLIAILIITIFYSHDISLIHLSLALTTIIGLLILNLRGYKKIHFYLILGTILWLMVLMSGIHPTVAGIILAIFIPQKDLLHFFIKKIAPVVNFLILPIFAFANSGVKIDNFALENLINPLVLGIVLGLFIGKQLGVMLFSFLAIKLGLAHLPRSPKRIISWFEFYGITILTGIGFTMSIFIGSLAFLNSPVLLEEAKIAILFGSFLSAVFGIIIIKISSRL